MIFRFHGSIFHDAAPVGAVGSVYSKELLERLRYPSHTWYKNFGALRVPMGAADEKCSAENRTVFVTYSYCHSRSVLAHAADQDCKDTRRVVSKALDESGITSMMKILNALKTSMRIVRILLVPKPPDQCSTIWVKISVSLLVIHQVSFSVHSVRSPKEFSGPAEISR